MVGDATVFPVLTIEGIVSFVSKPAAQTIRQSVLVVVTASQAALLSTVASIWPAIALTGAVG